MPYAHNDGVRIHYQVIGEDGPPLLLHHGLSDTLEGWRDSGWLDHLAREYRCILVDARGHGRSGRPHNPQAYSLGRRAGDLLAVLDDLELQRVHYLGYSLGGWVGFGLARFAPERLRSLTLLAAHPYAESMAFYREQLAAGLEKWTVTVETLAGHLPAAMKTRFLRNDLGALQASVAADRQDNSDLLVKTFTPVLLCVGTADSRYPGVRKCAAGLPRARLRVLPDYNHIQLFFASAELAPSVHRFLQKVEAGQSVRFAEAGTPAITGIGAT